MDNRKVFGNKITLFKQKGSPNWNARFYKNRVKIQTTLKTSDDREAERKAEQWFIQQLSELNGHTPQPKSSPSIPRVFPPTNKAHQFRYAAEQAIEDYKLKRRSPAYIHGLQKLFVRISEFIGTEDITLMNQTTWTSLQREIRKANPDISNKTLKQYRNGLQVVWKQAFLRGDLKVPITLIREYNDDEETPRTFFDYEAYEQLIKALRKNIADAKKNKSHRVRDCEELRDFVLMMSNCGTRCGEMMNVRFCDVTIETEDDKEYLEIRAIKGKRSDNGVCKSYYGAPRAFKRIVERHGLTLDNYKKETKSLWFSYHRDLFKQVLRANGLYQTTDRIPKTRVLASLRNTYICFALDRKQDLWTIARQCRTSTAMIERFYSAHKSILGNKHINKDYSALE